MSFSIATHTDTRWTVGCYALTALSLALLSMVLPWVSMVVLILLSWSTWNDKQGHIGWFRGWIPKQHALFRVHWKDDNNPETTGTLVHFHMSTQHHWWIRSASSLLFLTILCWVCVYMGWVGVSFVILPIICIVGIVGHKVAPKLDSTSISPEGIEVFAPAETTWNGLQLFFEHHHSVLSTKGRLIVYGKPSSIPIQLPAGFEEWTIDYQAV